LLLLTHQLVFYILNPWAKSPKIISWIF